METKICSTCGLEKPVSEFYSQKGHKHDVMSMCKSCFNTYCKDRWKNRKSKFIKLLGSECEMCHVKLTDSNYPIFDFHHIDPNTKEYNWNKLRLMSDKKVLNELSKCKLLCANCHRLIHSKVELVTPDGIEPST